MRRLLLVTGIVLIVSGCAKTTSGIILEGNPTTGYTWVCEMEDKTVADFTIEYTMDETEANIVGVGGTYKIGIEPLKNGETKLKCVYQKEWEPSDDDTVKEYTIIVKGKKVDIGLGKKNN